jgi:hypothetical protein
VELIVFLLSRGTQIPEYVLQGCFAGFEYRATHGLAVWEMAPPQPDGYTRMTKQFASVEVIVGDRDLDDVEIQVSPPTINCAEPPRFGSPF